MKRLLTAILMTAVIAALTACGSANESAAGYEQVSTSEAVAAKLAKNGYTNIVEFGGINSWAGEVVTE